MSEERLQEIKDSINFQYELIMSKGIDRSALLFTDEEQELLEEVERLNNIINELEKWIEKNKQFQVISERCIVWEDKLIDKLQELKGSDKE